MYMLLIVMGRVWNFFRECCKGTVYPSSTCYFMWLATVTLAVVYNLLSVILRVTFTQAQSGQFLRFGNVCDSISDAIYLIDLQVKFRTAFFKDGQLVDDQAVIAQYYGKSRQLLIDILSIIPGDFLLHNYLHVTCVTALRFNRLLRLSRMADFFNRMEHRVKRPLLLRIGRLLLYIITIIHWNACLYIIISRWIGFGSDNWVYFDIDDDRHPENATFARMYIYAFYWSTLTLSTIGELGTPERNVEFVFMIINFMVGIFIFATIVSHVNEMINSLSEDREEFRYQLDGVKFYMQNHSVSEKVQDYLVGWFEYLWQTDRPLHLESKLQDLPSRLQAKLKLSVMEKAIEKSIFRRCDRRFLKELALRLRHDVFSPGEYICRRGDVGREMYMILKGKMGVKLNGETVFLQDGDIFGEISLLDIPGNTCSNRRSADVRSIGYSDVFILSKNDLDSILDDFIGVRETLVAHATDELNRSRRLQIAQESALESPPPVQESYTEEVSVEDRISGLVNRVDDVETSLNVIDRKLDRILDMLRMKM